MITSYIDIGYNLYNMESNLSDSATVWYSCCTQVVINTLL